MIYGPFEGADLIAKIIGAIILSYAILDIISTITIKRNIKKLHKEIKESVESVVDAVVIDDEEEKKEVKKIDKPKKKTTKPKKNNKGDK